MFERWLDFEKDKNYILTGPRRAGKTTLLKNRFEYHKYITLDDFDYLEMAENDPKALALLSPNLIIDEAQRVPKISIAVKYAIDEAKSNIHLSGSSRIGLLDANYETLAGRIEPQSLPTFCFGEEVGPSTHSIFDDEVSLLQLREASRLLENAFIYGGFPEVVSSKEEEEKIQILKNYRNTYFTRDLAFISNIENVSGLLAILNHYSISLGSLAQVSSFGNESGLSHQTAKKYLNMIYQSELGFKLSGYQYGAAKRSLKAPKSYFADNGIITALNSGSSRGQIIENFVISEIEKRRKLKIYDIDEIYYYQTIGGSEIDLIMPFPDHLKAIEIKATNNPSQKTLGNLKKFISTSKQKVKGYLFYTGLEYKVIDGIKLIPIASFYRGK
ncbi:MAG: ATP-binding protein [Bdellovibrionales bacterium]|nr:ATP-binding protein [Bdellovibrionales bacterium]